MGMEDAKKSVKLSIVRIALRDLAFLAFSRVKSNLYDYTRSGFNTP